MDPKDWIALAGMGSTVILALANLWFAQRREKSQRERDDKLRALERGFVPRIEYDIQCRFYGPEENEYLTEIHVIVNNRGNLRRKYKSMRIRVRGIERGSALSFWPGRGGRLQFPTLLLNDDFIEQGRGWFYFVEPGVRQVFTYVTKTPERVKYIAVHVRLT